MSSDSGRGMDKGIIKVKLSDLCVFISSRMDFNLCHSNVKSSLLIIIAEVCTKHCPYITPNVSTALKTSLKMCEYEVKRSSGHLIL